MGGPNTWTKERAASRRRIGSGAGMQLTYVRPAIAALLALPGTVHAESHSVLAQTGSTLGMVAVAVFFVAYVFVVLEERLHLRKSKPVMLGAAIIWALIAWHAAA